MHLRSLLQIGDLFAAVPPFEAVHFACDQCRIFGNTLGVLMRSHVLGIDCVCYGHDRLICHVDLDLLLVELSLDNKPCEPDQEQREQYEHIYPESPLLIDLTDLDDLELALFKDLLTGTVKYGKMERVISRRKINVIDVIQIVLRNDGPLLIISFKEVSDIRFLNGVVQYLRCQFKTTDPLTDRDRACARERLLHTVHAHGCELHPVRTDITVVFVDVDDIYTGIARKEQFPVSVVMIP